MNKCIYTIGFLLMFLSAELVYADSNVSPVVDNADFLTDEQEVELTKQLNELRNKYNVDVAIYTESDMSGYDAQSTADNIYDYNGYGLSENDDGILYYVCKNPRNYAFTTYGYGEKAFNSNGLRYLDENLLPHLEKNDYNGAFTAYVDNAGKLLQKAAVGKPYDMPSASVIAITIGAIIILPLLIAFAMTMYKLSSAVTAVKATYANNYISGDGIKLTLIKDVYLYSNITRTKKPEIESQSHTSSSGRSHGGRSGSY